MKLLKVSSSILCANLATSLYVPCDPCDENETIQNRAAHTDQQIQVKIVCPKYHHINSSNKCVKNECICENGTPNTESCAKHLAHQCQCCNEGYDFQDWKCFPENTKGRYSPYGFGEAPGLSNTAAAEKDRGEQRVIISSNGNDEDDYGTEIPPLNYQYNDSYGQDRSNEHEEDQNIVQKEDDEDNNLETDDCNCASPRTIDAKCKGNVGAYFAHVNDETKFFHCSHMGAHEKTCAKGTVWRQDWLICNHF